MDASTGGTVTKLVFEVIDPSVALIEMAVALLARSVARPVPPILTVVGLDDTQVTEEVIVAFVPLL
jgi:hypothetical protein